MSSAEAAALGAAPLWRLRIESRLLQSLGIASLAVAVALFAAATLPVLERTGLGLLVAVGVISLGHFLAGRRSDQLWFSGTTTMAAGYALAAFFAYASYYLNSLNLQALGSPYLCWLLELSLATVAVVHAARNSILRWAAVPFTLLLGIHVLFHSLTSSDVVAVAGLSMKVSAIASVTGTLWLAGLCALYKQLGEGASAGAVKALYSLAHEGCFLAAAVSALALPNFLNSLEYAPVWWALETPVLLAICWRDRSFIKHAFVMGISALSAVLVLLNKLDLGVVVSMAVPLSGAALAMVYRFVPSSWAHWQKVTGYATYLYGSVLVAIALPLTKLGAWEALPYFLFEAAALLSLALALRDRVLQQLGLLAGAGSLALYAAFWQQWDVFATALVVAGCYGFSLTYGWAKKSGGWSGSEFVPFGRRHVLSAREAGWLEIVVGAAGYVVMMSGTYLLLDHPFNTIAWGVLALGLILFGFATDKMGHRFSGVVGIFATCAKLWILDLSGAGAGVRTAVGFAVFGVCSITAGIFYLVEYVWKTKKPDSTDDESSDDRDAADK